ncbi:hypothetical protein HAX54_016221 [Datura stramonium]|uniref:Uncharacterized protein n=1 Tax=Datura stramonium TaxID=4076 RepID=A0ABS8UKR5_DATST|nr:hypothetical protein [Datura stramonium]
MDLRVPMGPTKSGPTPTANPVPACALLPTNRTPVRLRGCRLDRRRNNLQFFLYGGWFRVQMRKGHEGVLEKQIKKFRVKWDERRIYREVGEGSEENKK